MTLIECFTESHIDNIATCLRLRPDKMILVGDGADMAVPARRYRKLLEKRGQQTEISLCDVRGKDFPEICAFMHALVKEQQACVIDLTGGQEPVIMAVGAVLAALEPEARERIRVEKYDYETDTVRDCVNDNRKIPYAPVGLTVEELVALHGGVLHPQTQELPADCTPEEIAGIWQTASREPKEWNQAIAYLNEFESRADSKTQVYLPLDYLHGSINNFDRKDVAVRELLEKLHRCGAIRNQSSWHSLEYTYTTPLMRYCTQKAGNVLEMKTLLEGRGVLENGAPFFQDCRMGVSIDWDGIIHAPEEHRAETRNEIDVVLMHGLTPLFISCKNGGIGEEELYKLHTVAERFGGVRAKKMLIATELQQKNPASNRATVQRAWDMDIFMVTDAGDLSREEWKQIFRDAMQ